MKTLEFSGRHDAVTAWSAAILLSLAWHIFWLVPKYSPEEKTIVHWPPPPQLQLLSLSGSDRSLLTPILFSLNPGVFYNDSDHEPLRANPPLDLPHPPSISFQPFLLSVPYAVILAPACGVFPRSTHSSVPPPSLKPEEPSGRSAGPWAIQIEPGTLWAAEDFLATPLPELPLPASPWTCSVWLHFDADGFVVSALITSPDASSDFQSRVQAKLHQWQIRRDRAPCSGTVFLRYSGVSERKENPLP